MTLVPGMILAGGLSRRMGGGDKGLLRLTDRTILGHVIERLSPQTDPLALNANGDAGRFSDYGLRVVGDGVSGHPGPLAGILAAMDWAAELGETSVVTAAADTPFLPENLVAGLQAARGRDNRPISLAATTDSEHGTVRHPTFGLWPVALREDLRSALLLGTRKVVAWTDRHGAALAVFPSDPTDPFFNVNTPEDLDFARGLAKTMAGQ